MTTETETKPAEEAVREALGEIVDPCSAANGSNLNIVEMGLVKEVSVSDGEVVVEMRLTTPACHMVPYFIDEAEERLGVLPGVRLRVVQRSPAWVLRMGRTEIALDDALASRIRVLTDGADPAA